MGMASAKPLNEAVAWSAQPTEERADELTLDRTAEGGCPYID
jgi:hypothetical protein